MANGVLKKLQNEFSARGIKHVQVAGTDIDGVLRGKQIHAEKFTSALEHGFGFCDVIFGWDIVDALYDRSSVTGWESGFPDALAKIDASTFRVHPNSPNTADFLVDFHTQDGAPHPACPRSLLKSVIKRTEDAGFTPKFSAEFEFWIFREDPASLRTKRFHDLTPLSPGMFGYSMLRAAQSRALVDDIWSTTEAYGIQIEGLHTETGPGVWEAALRYNDAIEAADQAVLFKTLMKDICHRHGLSVTFMAKWNAALPGSSGHIHQSLWKDGANAFIANDVDPSDPRTALSPLGRHYLGGLVTTLPELTALYSPFVNSYRRFVPGVWAPLNASWGIENRTCAVRVIHKPSPESSRVELRQTAADINPYTAMATSLAAGLHGIEHKIEPPSATTGDASLDSLTSSASPAPLTLPLALPLTLDAAVARLKASKVAKKLLTPEFIEHYAMTREWEVRQANRAVSSWELERYFESV